MTAPTMDPVARGPRRHSHANRHRALLAFVMMTSLTASGCGMSLPFRHARVATPPAPPRAMSLAEQIADAEANAAQAPAEAYWPWRAGVLYAAADSLAGAEAALGQALARDPDYAPALSLLSKLEFTSGRHEDAVQLLEAARERAQQASRELDPELLAGLALHYDAMSRVNGAPEALSATPQPGNAAASPVAVAEAMREGAADSVPQRALAAVRDNPASAACQNNYGIARLRAGEADEARTAFMKAIELDPTRAGPYYNLAILEKYYALDDAAAARWFAHARAHSNEDPDGLIQTLGQTHSRDLAEEREP